MLFQWQAIRREAPRLGGSFAVWGGLFSTFDCTLVAVRHKVTSECFQMRELTSALRKSSLRHCSTALRPVKAASLQQTKFRKVFIPIYSGIQRPEEMLHTTFPTGRSLELHSGWLSDRRFPAIENGTKVGSTVCRLWWCPLGRQFPAMKRACLT